MAARTPPPPGKPLTIPILVLAGAGTIVASWLHYPGAAVMLIGIIAAAYLATPPLLTGPKDASGQPTPAGASEEQAYKSFGLWRAMRSSLFLPSPDWLANSSETRPRFAITVPWLSVVATPLGTLAWLVVSLRPIWWLGVGAAALAFTLPVEAFGYFDGRWLNAAAAFWCIIPVAAVVRKASDPQDPSPGASFEVLFGRRDGQASGAFVLGGLVVAAITVGAGSVWVLGLVNWMWLFEPRWLFGIGLALVTFGGLGLAVTRAASLELWRARVSARAEWGPRWAALKLSPPPNLIDFSQVGQAQVATFQTPGQLGGASAIFNMFPKIRPLLGAGVTGAVLYEPNVDGQGQPMPGTRHPLNVRIVVWPVDAAPDFADPKANTDELGLFLESVVSNAATQMQVFQPAFLGMEAVSTPDSETAAWATYWAGVDAPAESTFGAIGADICGQTAGECHVDPSNDGGATVYVGLPTSSLTTLNEPDVLLPRLERMEVTARWNKRWYDLLKQGQRPPIISYDLNSTAKLSNGAVLHRQAFQTFQGLTAAPFFKPEIEQGLSSTLKSAPFVTVAAFGQQGFREGERHATGFYVIWSDSAVPSDPTNISPASDRDAANWALTGAINSAFDAVGLKRPEVVRADALTERDTFAHIWGMRLRLYDGETTATVKARAEKLRVALGCGWLRITEADDGCMIYAGADPRRPDVVFARPTQRNQDTTIALDWEQAFLDSKVQGLDGSAPKLLATGTMPKNPKVQVLEFSIPRGLSIQFVRDSVQKLRAASRNDFVEVRNGLTPDQFTLLVSEENPMPFPAPFAWDDLLNDEGILFGTGVDGEHIRYDWREDPHLMVLGGTGSGKSATLQNFITAALLKGCQVYVADAIKLAADFRYAEPWLKAIATDAQSASAMMDTVYAEVKRRVALNGQYGAASYRDLPEEVRPPHIVVFIDEFTSLMLANKPQRPPAGASEQTLRDFAALEAENNAKRNIGAKAGQLVREARSAGVTLILAGQALKQDTIDQIPNGKSLKGGMASLLLGKSRQGDLMSALKSWQDAPDIGDVVPRGRGIFESSLARPMTVQSWYDQNHVESLVEHLSELVPMLTPEQKVDLSEAITPDAPVFGEIIARDETSTPGSSADGEDEVVVDLGVLDLSDMFASEESVALAPLPTPVEENSDEQESQSSLDVEFAVAEIAADEPATAPLMPLPIFQVPPVESVAHRGEQDDLFADPAPQAPPAVLFD